MCIEVIDAGALHNHYKDDFIVVTDDDGQRLSKFSTSGRFINAIYSFELGLASARFLYVALDYYANVYITDDINNQIHKFDHNLQYIISEGRTGTDKGEFYSPRGISIGRRYGQVFITEKEGGQYLWIAVDGFFVGCFPRTFTHNQPGTTVAIYLTQEAKINATVFNQMQEKVKDLLSDIKIPPGEFLFVWDGRDNANQFVPEGDYEIRVNLKGLHGHGTRIKKSIKGSVRCKVS